MTDLPLNGYVLNIRNGRADVNAPGGFRVFLFVAIARSEAHAKQVVDDLVSPGCEVVDSGPEVLQGAKALGVRDGDAIVLPD